jgi:catechol 2,3-dioxygenase
MQNDIQQRPLAMFAPRRLAHANVFVSDLEESLTFYSAVCGMTEVFREPGIKAIFLSNGSSHHDFAIMGTDNEPRIGRDGHVQIPSGRGTLPALNHLGWEMESEKVLVDAYRRALSSGVDVKRTTDHGMSHSVYLFDPEEIFLEFYADATADWKAFYAKSQNQLISGEWDPLAQEPSMVPLYNADFKPEFVSQAPVHPRQIARATLIVKDFERAKKFYQDVAGLEPLHTDVDRQIAVLAGSTRDPSLALFGAREGEACGLHHLGFELVDDIERERLEADLRRIKASPVETIDNSGKTSVVLRSPDGLLLEFYQQKGGQRWSADAGRGDRDLHLI